MILCADDFGLAPDINRAILDLADQNRITAVSSIVALSSSGCEPFRLLATRGDHLDLGLHLNLINTPPLSPPKKVASLIDSSGRLAGFRQLLSRSLARRVQACEAADEITEQYNRFLDFFCRPPDFIDSHLHVHQFPGIREGLLAFLGALPPNQRPYVRNTWMPPRKIIRQRVAISKAAWIDLLGLSLKKRLKAQGAPTNDGFAGVYNYCFYRRFPRYLTEFIRHMEPGNSILMVHPGLQESWRRMEYDVLREANISMVRFARNAACP